MKWMLIWVLAALVALNGCAAPEPGYRQISQILAELGYTNVYEFGGINTWPYEIEKP